MKIITKPKVLFTYMHRAMLAKDWNIRALDHAVGSKIGFNNVVAGTTNDMKLVNILRILEALDLELVVRPKEKKPQRRRTYTPTNALPQSAPPKEEVPEA